MCYMGTWSLRVRLLEGFGVEGKAAFSGFLYRGPPKAHKHKHFNGISLPYLASL